MVCNRAAQTHGVSPLFFLSLLLFPAVARGDVFVLRSGGQIEAEWLNRTETPRTIYRLRTASGGEMPLAREAVKDVLKQSEVEKRYQELLPRMPNTADGNWKMAEWCRERGLTSLREQHLQAVIALESDHEAAHFGLGHIRIKGEWTTRDEAMRSQGYVRDGGVWRLPQELELVKAQSGAKQAEIDWRAKLRQLRAKLGKKGGDRALDEIRAIRDPAAAPILVGLLDDKNESAVMKLEYLNVLGHIDSGVATAALVQNFLHSEDDRVRDVCLDFLEERKSQQLTDLFVRKLRDDSPRIIRRAAEALGRFQDPETTLPLIESLVTRHKKTITSGGGGLSPAFGSDGSSGLSAGGGTKVLQYDVQHDEVLAALATIHANVNFGFDKLAWKAWYVQSKTPRDVALRRDKD